MSPLVLHEGARFLLAGALNTVATYAIYLLLLSVLGYTLAYSVAFIMGIFIAYAMNSRYVFRVAASLRTFALFPLVYVAQYLVGVAALRIAVIEFGVHQRYALLASIMLTIPMTFLLSRLLLKRGSELSPQPGKPPIS